MKEVHWFMSCFVLCRPCFFGWSKQFNHSHPPSTNFNQLQPLLSTTKFHCIPFSTHFNLLQPTSPIYHRLFITERNRPVVWYNVRSFILEYLISYDWSHRGASYHVGHDSFRPILVLKFEKYAKISIKCVYICIYICVCLCVYEIYIFLKCFFSN